MARFTAEMRHTLALICTILAIISMSLMAILTPILYYHIIYSPMEETYDQFEGMYPEKYNDTIEALGQYSIFSFITCRILVLIIHVAILIGIVRIYYVNIKRKDYKEVKSMWNLLIFLGLGYCIFNFHYLFFLPLLTAVFLGLAFLNARLAAGLAERKKKKKPVKKGEILWDCPHCGRELNLKRPLKIWYCRYCKEKIR